MVIFLSYANLYQRVSRCHVLSWSKSAKGIQIYPGVMLWSKSAKCPNISKYSIRALPVKVQSDLLDGLRAQLDAWPGDRIIPLQWMTGQAPGESAQDYGKSMKIMGKWWFTGVFVGAFVGFSWDFMGSTFW